MVNEESVNDKEAPAKEVAEEKPVLTPEQQKAKNRKIFTVVTYSIALFCMLAGIFVPLYGPVSGGNAADKLFLKFVPGVFNALLYPFVKKNIIPLPDVFFVNYPANEQFSSVTLALAIYLITCLVGLFILIPVLLGNREKRTSVICAYVIEALAALSGGYFLFATLGYFAWGEPCVFGTPSTVYNFVIVFCGVLLMMAIQSIYNKGGLGVTKIILMVLSALAFLIILLGRNEFISGLGKIFDPLSEMLGSGEKAAFANGTNYFAGIDAVGYFAGIEALGFTEYFEVMELGLVDKLFYIVCGIFVCVCAFDFAYDVFEISAGSKYDKQGVLSRNKPMSVFAVLRYTIALILAVMSIALLLISKDVKPGVYLYIATVIVVIQLIFAIVRSAVLASKRKKAVKEDEISVKSDPAFGEDVTFYDENPANAKEINITIETPIYKEKEFIYEKEPDYDEPEYDEPDYLIESDYGVDDEDEQLTIPGTPQPENETEERTYVYNYKAVYNGPTDEFMDTLTEVEKIEFVQIFVEHTKGKIKGVPDYSIGGDNSDFFPAVFIHINKAREIVSTHLLGKIYKQMQLL